MDYELINDGNNKVIVSGVVETMPEHSHEVMDEKFYDFMLKIKRLSGYSDIIPVTISEKMLQENAITKGSEVCFNGQFRSYNKQTEEKSRLILTVFVKEMLEFENSENKNSIELTGFVCKQPIYRTTPFNREICDVLIAVNRNYNKSDYLPCIAWGKNAKTIRDCAVGQKVKLSGRIQSRAYQKKINNNEVVEKVAYEISLSKIEKQHNSEQVQGQQMEMSLFAN